MRTSKTKFLLVLLLVLGAALAALIYSSQSGFLHQLFNSVFGNKDGQATYGRLIEPVTVIASDEDEAFPASNVLNHIGLAGSGGKLQTHLTDARTMWRASSVQGAEVSLEFDFGKIIPLSEIWIWNFNESDHDGLQQTNRGLKEIKVFVTTDGSTWQEWKGDGYPFVLAKANGSNKQKATNLNNDAFTPITLDGANARGVKLVAQAVVGQGNWGGANSKESSFGLSEVEFYSYVEDVQVGSIISVKDVISMDEPSDALFNMVNHYGMSGMHASKDTHDADDTGKSMWLGTAKNDSENIEVIYDLGGTYPLAEMDVWNYNQGNTNDSSKSYTAWGLKNIQIFYSMDQKNWTELKAEGYPYRLTQADGSAKLQATNLDDGSNSPILFHNTSTRYVKVVASKTVNEGNWGGVSGDEAKFGLSEVRFFAGEGLVAESAPEWDMLFSKYFEWTGADGIFTIPLSGNDQPQDKSSKLDMKTLFLFSDTFIGAVDTKTKKRTSSSMPNNTIALLKGGQPDPANMVFTYGTLGEGIDTKAIFIPDVATVKPDYVESDIPGNFWYWLQDGVMIDNHVYIFPMLMISDPSQPSAFQFKTDGVALIKIPLNENHEPDLTKATQQYTPLYYKDPTTKAPSTFGAGIFANTVSAGAPAADGYVYTYGYRDQGGKRLLLVARVLEEKFTSFDDWTYYNGSDWVANIADAAPLAENVSPELSVSPFVLKDGKMRYILMYQKGTLGSLTAYRWADQPWGPFGDEQLIYQNTDNTLGSGVFSYNAKAHPSLSEPGELLVTYNVNTISFQTNFINADVYRPRWFRIKELAK